MANCIGVQNCYSDYTPLYKDVKEFFDTLFAMMPQDDEFIFQAHFVYASNLEKFIPMYPELHKQAITHLGKAIASLERLVERKDLDDWSRKNLDRFLQHLKKKYAQKLKERVPEEEQYTEEEYLKQRNELAERFRIVDDNIRFMRQFQIKKGLLNPTDPQQYLSFGNRDIEDPEFQEFKKRMLEEERKGKEVGDEANIDRGAKTP